jgi:aflatoxin B1 aldehyde reductase
MTFGPDESTGARITSLDEYKKHLDHFQSQGYNEIDTARVYVGGKQEAWTADAGYKERGLTIASKWYPSEPGAHKAQKVKEIVNKSLEELRTDKIDIYYLHAGMPEFTFGVLIRDHILTQRLCAIADRTTPFHETLKAINDLHKEGKFDTFAISNFTAAEVAEVCTICQYEGWVR